MISHVGSIVPSLSPHVQLQYDPLTSNDPVTSSEIPSQFLPLILTRKTISIELDQISIKNFSPNLRVSWTSLIRCQICSITSFVYKNDQFGIGVSLFRFEFFTEATVFTVARTISATFNGPNVAEQKYLTFPMTPTNPDLPTYAFRILNWINKKSADPSKSSREYTYYLTAWPRYVKWPQMTLAAIKKASWRGTTHSSAKIIYKNKITESLKSKKRCHITFYSRGQTTQPPKLIKN